jgi:hypothetical protein
MFANCIAIEMGCILGTADAGSLRVYVKNKINGLKASQWVTIKSIPQYSAEENITSIAFVKHAATFSPLKVIANCVHILQCASSF